jgi:hypothetical protein
VAKKGDCDQISLQFFLRKNPGKSPQCSLCQMPQNDMVGTLLAFQSGRSQICAHLNCLKYTTIVDTAEKTESRISHDFRNVFEAVEKATTCKSCFEWGATVGCANPDCSSTYHFHCAEDSGWNFEKKGKEFSCPTHRHKQSRSHAEESSGMQKKSTENNGGNSSLMFQHNLLSQFGATGPRIDVPGNLDIGGTTAPEFGESSPEKSKNGEDSESDDESFPGEDAQGIEVMDIPLSQDVSGPKQLVRLERSSREEFWNLSLKFVKVDGANVVSVAAVPQDAGGLFSLQERDILVSINGLKIGSDGLRTLRDILFRLKQEVDLMLQVVRKDY